MRYRELEADFSSSYGEPVLQTQFPNLEISAATVFTKEIYKLFCPVLRRACNCVVVGSSHRRTKFVYNVTRHDKEGCHWQVSFCQDTLEFKCSCLMFESLGIPCAHIVSILLLLEIKRLPDSTMLKRWTKNAKDTIVLPCSNKGAPRDPDLISIYVGIVERCKKLATADC